MSSTWKHLRHFALLGIVSSMISACAVKTVYTIMEPGRPGMILENVKVQFRQLASDGQSVQQDVGGWVAMPPAHWNEVKAALEELERLRK